MGAKKMIIGAGLIILFVMVLGLSWLIITRNPIIWTFRESGNPSPIPMYAIFNPFRDKKPEIDAENLLIQFKNGNCEEVLLNMVAQEKYVEICERESRFKLLDWRLRYREDKERKAELYYSIMREPDPDSDFKWSMRIGVEQINGEWKITDIGSIY